MKSIINTLLLIGAVIMILVWMGLLDTDQILDAFAGEVEMGETEQIYKESDFMERFDMIVGEVEVNDTSNTEFKRNSAFCEAAYVVTTTNAMIKYEVKTTPELFYLDVNKKEYYISPDLGVTYYQADRVDDTAIEESNCIKERHIGPEAVEKARRTADLNFQKAIDGSDKIIAANQRFNEIKSQLLQDFIEAGFTEVKPESTFAN